MSDETTTTEADRPKCPTEVLGLLWRAFSLRGCDDSTGMKARLARRFKALMQEAKLYVQQPNGSVLTQLDPRGGLQFVPKTPKLFTPTHAEAEYLQERVTELKDKRNQDGSHMVDASAADHIDDIEKIWLPLWLPVEKPETPAVPGPAATPALSAPVADHVEAPAA